MTTIKLFHQDVYIKEWDAELVDLKDNKIFLDRTAFFPEGGGQSCDIGFVKVYDSGRIFNVIDVQEEGEEIVHTLDADTLQMSEMRKGLKVKCTLDWERRFDNMQRHCGEHILSGIFYQECGGINRGFHMGEDYMTIDISLEDEPTSPGAVRPNEITWDIAMHCELLANKVIWTNAPVRVFRFDSRKEAEKMPLRKKLAFDEAISIVCVGSPENAADCVACCGTHPSTAGQLGLIKIYKVENYKSMFRIYFEAGQRALKDYSFKHAMLTDLSNSYSSSIEDLPAKIRLQEEKLSAAKGELSHIKKAFIERECLELDKLIASSEDNAMIKYDLADLSLDDAFNMSKSYMGKERCRGKLLMLYSIPSCSYILVSDGKIPCGNLVKEYASFYQGKGGGNDLSARAIFTGEENARLFADLLSKHLK